MQKQSFTFALNTTKKMYIKQVYIKNLWQKGNIVWDFQDDVNVLVGINGSGKSTVLNLIYEALQPEISEEAKKRYFSLIGELTIHLSDNSFILVDSSGERFPVKIDHLDINISKISTFDIANSLDDLIEKLHIKFEIYQKNLYKRFEESLKIPGTLPNSAVISEIFGRRKIFIDTINVLFKETGKSFSEDNFKFKLDKQQYELFHTQLSSGEKQIFYILLQALIQDGKQSISLLDEPEISLHIEWQRDLIHNIRQLNENCQVIAVTHSSNMYFKGWHDKKINIDEIRHEKSNRIQRIDIKSNLATFAEGFKKIAQSRLLGKEKVNQINTMLHRSFFILPLTDCNSILKTMIDASITPDVFTYSTLISKTTNKADAEKLLKEMKKKKITPNVVTYVNVLKRTESFEEAMEVFDWMRIDRIEPVIQHFGALLGKADTPEFVQKVEELRAMYEVPTNDIYANKLHIKK
jgi:ABC-type lipoprotein export system ATPase subunit